MTADEVKKMLGLVPHPREGGWYVRTYESKTLAQNGTHKTGTAIYYLLEPETLSQMHLLKSDEVFHFYAGDAVEQVQLLPDGTGCRIVIGSDLLRGDRPQVVVPAGVWQGSRLVRGGRWALLGCTVSPGFEYVDYEDGVAEELLAGWPAWAREIRALTRV